MGSGDHSVIALSQSPSNQEKRKRNEETKKKEGLPGRFSQHVGKEGWAVSRWAWVLEKVVVNLGSAWVGHNVLDGFGGREDFLGVFVGDLNRELLLQNHHNLHSVQTVQAKILEEMGVLLQLLRQTDAG